MKRFFLLCRVSWILSIHSKLFLELKNYRLELAFYCCSQEDICFYNCTVNDSQRRMRQNFIFKACSQHISIANSLGSFLQRVFFTDNAVMQTDFARTPKMKIKKRSLNVKFF